RRSVNREAGRVRGASGLSLTLNGRPGSADRRWDIGAYPFDDGCGGRSRSEYPSHTELLQFGDVVGRNDAAAEYHDVARVTLREHLDDSAEQCHVRAGEHG